MKMIVKLQFIDIKSCKVKVVERYGYNKKKIK